MAFVPRAENPSNPLVGQQFELTEDVSNMDGTFEKGTIMTCYTVDIRYGTGIRSVWLKDDLVNTLLLNYNDFLKICKKC